MSSTLNQLLAQVQAPGTFATRHRASADDLALEVKGVGPVTFPISAKQLKSLRAVACPSPFGLGEETLLDPNVRHSWEVAPSRVKVDHRRWKPALAAHLGGIRRELGFPEGCVLEAVLDKLLLYEKGQFFKPHQDSEKDDTMVGTLVVLLPSAYAGGAVTVEHRGEKRTFKRLASQRRELSLLAFYADCRHAVSPVTSGVRVALTYRLRLTDGRGAPLAGFSEEDVGKLMTALRGYFETPVPSRYGDAVGPPPDRFVYLLDHEYTQHSLSWTGLKNGDRARVASLREAARRLDGESYLALAEVHETWDYQDDRRWGRKGRYGSDDDSDADSDGEVELVSMIESDTALTHWIDADGRRVEGMFGNLRKTEAHFTTSSDDLKPYRTEREGYQGNYGNTLDRWYHRAAFLMWPRSRTFSLRAQASPQWAVKELMAMPDAQRAELAERVRSLLPHWGWPVSQMEEASFWSGVMKVAQRLEEASTARSWLEPMGLHRLGAQATQRGFVTLVAKHGLAWAKTLVATWTARRRWETPDWAPMLAGLCQELRASGGKSGLELARWLVEQDRGEALNRCTHSDKPVPWGDFETFADEARYLAHVLAAAAVLGVDEMVSSSLEAVLHATPAPSVSLLVSIVRACKDASPTLWSMVEGSPLHRDAVSRLEVISNGPKRAADDWSIEWPLGCACTDCRALGGFLSSGRIVHAWPLSERRRQHIHQQLDRLKLPVTHETLRKGSPYVLQLSKDRSLFTRDADRRRRAQELLSGFTGQTAPGKNRSR
ncbi:MAG: hypothetical protein RL199_898 [Pseudomonadota bacterium]|jgi:hypothetical protein